MDPVRTNESGRIEESDYETESDPIEANTEMADGETIVERCLPLPGNPQTIAKEKCAEKRFFMVVFLGVRFFFKVTHSVDP